MIAQPGDWLVVAGRTDHDSGRRGEILSARSASGEPPYTVRWLDTGRTALVFPGPDAVIMSAAELAELDRRAAERFDLRRGQQHVG
ncbi:MAG TPA: DUF1918 domain-containing protein [Nakamurella sp.]|jgi:hypothetical protein|nr:DUF1918 domain-containing protein [Nakamurella sp.]